MSTALTLKSLLAHPSIVVAPGAPDSLTARLIQQLGFNAVYMTGLGVTAKHLGTPDLGLLTQTEMADHAKNMARAVEIPVIADADTGYGGPLNIQRTVDDYLHAGVAALHLEDQENPKRCGQLSGIRLAPVNEARLRLKAAIASRGTDDLIIIARTDALPLYGIEEAADRAKCYQDAGVDLVFIDGAKTCAEIEAIAKNVTGPKVVSVVDGTDASNLSCKELENMGFDLALFAVTALFAQAGATLNALQALKEKGLPAFAPHHMTYQDFSHSINLTRHQNFARLFEPES